jgi:hypothetical protein
MSSPKGAKAPARKAGKAAPRASAKKTPAAKKAVAKQVGAKKPAARAASVEGAPSPAQKAAFLKAMAGGVKPNSTALRKLEEKKGSPFAPSAPAPERKVEVLRRIPAPARIEETPATRDALRLAAFIESGLAKGELENIQPHAQQALAAALCRLYAANHEAGNRYPILGVRGALVTATDVMVMCGALLKAVDLQVFELGMWQSWSSS